MPTDGKASGPPLAAADLSATLASIGENAADVLRAVARMSPLAMVLADPSREDCPLVYCNRAFTRLTGYAQEQVSGRNLRFLQGERTDQSARAVLRAAVAYEREAQVELWNYQRDGSEFWCSMFVGPVFDNTGALVYWFGSQLDAGARHEMETARAHARRVETLGAMAAGIAHEFNNLMTVVVGSAEGVRADPLTPRQSERLDRVDWGARAAGRLTKQMLSFAGKSDLHATLVDVNEVLRSFDRFLAHVADDDTRLEMRLADERLMAVIDVRELELALVNLVKNASAASPPGSPISVTTSRMVHQGKPQVQVEVTDRGTGMPPYIAERATEPFFSTKAHGDGTGLGLSMVSGFVQQSGGTLDIVSAPGRGTTVRLIFLGAPEQGA